jgi:broad specificity phosphatase PhoE
MEGGPIFDFSEDPPLKRALRSNWFTMVLQLSGEAIRRFGVRVAQAAREIAHQRVLLVVHNAVRNLILARLVDGDPGAYVRYDSWPACAYTEIEVTADGSARLLRLNVNDHLSSILAS